MDEKKIIYQVLPRLWGDGKMPSWDKESFDYLRLLGTDYIWMTGIPRHSSGKSFVKGCPGSPYAISDWYDINPYLALDEDHRMEEFEALVARVHSAGLKLIIDYVPNHVGRDYEGGLPLYDWNDADWTDTLKVNWSDPATEDEFVRVLNFWAQKGVDGFRCDMVELVPAESLANVITRVKLSFPNLLFVAEVYKRENYKTYIESVGFDLLYDKSGVYDTLRGVISGVRSARELSWNWQFLGGLQGHMLNFLENHDEQRIASPAFAGTVDKAWAAVAYAMLFNAASWMIYAGQEVGETASGSADGRTSIFNWSHPEGLSHISEFVRCGSGLSEKEMDILARYRRLSTLAHSPLFRQGNVWDLCYCNLESPGFDPDRNTVFVRFDGNDAMVVLCNFSSSAISTDIVIPPELREIAKLEKTEASLYAPAYGYSLLKLK